MTQGTVRPDRWVLIGLTEATQEVAPEFGSKWQKAGPTGSGNGHDVVSFCRVISDAWRYNDGVVWLRSGRCDGTKKRG